MHSLAAQDAGERYLRDTVGFESNLHHSLFCTWNQKWENYKYSISQPMIGGYEHQICTITEIEGKNQAWNKTLSTFHIFVYHMEIHVRVTTYIYI